MHNQYPILTKRLSQIPLASFASVLASSGAITITSAHLLSSICKIGSFTLFQS